MAGAARRRTKIVATIGPASEDRDTLRALVDAGMDGARLNFSHGTQDDHARRNALVREVQEEVGRPLSVIADLQGPKLRIGELEGPVTLARGEDVVVAGGERSDDGELPVSPAVISEVLQPGHEVLIDDGLVRLRVETIEAGRARCAVLTGGVVSSHKGVNLPGVP
ncbi:MAG: pyruvate kinase, partial [Gaiellaceae bacterium]